MQLSLFDERDLAEISAPEMFPGERLIVCRNRDLAAERARKREELLAATERELARIQAQVRRQALAVARRRRDRPGSRRVWSTVGRWPSISPSRSAMATSHSSAGSNRSRQKLASTAST